MGGNGGDATAEATSSIASASTEATAVATATGGVGGLGGPSGSGDPSGNAGDAGNGGTATAQASATNPTGAAEADAYSYGGAGGAGYNTVSDITGSGGNGGTASGTTAFASGSIDATAKVVQAGGTDLELDNFDEPAAGAGASSSLTNAVSGYTVGGDLTLEQDAAGGNGGYTPYGGVGGAAGSATSNLTFDDNKNPTQSNSITSTVDATGGAGGGSFVDYNTVSNYSGGTVATGGDAAVNENITGTGEIYATGSATGGGAGGDAAPSDSSAAGGAASSTVVASGMSAVTAEADATGGGGSVVNNTVNGPGGDANASATATGSSATANASAVAGSGIGGNPDGSANATATATGATLEAGAEADATAVGTSGSAESTASTGLTGTADVTGSASAAAQVTYNYIDTTDVRVRTGNQNEIFVTPGQAGDNSLSAGNLASVDAVGAPGPNTLDNLTATNTPVIYQDMLNPTDQVAGAAILEANYDPTASGSVLETYVAHVTFQPAAAFGENLLLGLVNYQEYGFDSDASSLENITLSVTEDATTLLSESFTTVAAAEQFLTDNVIDLGAATDGSTPVTLQLSVTASGSGGFAGDLLLGTGPSAPCFAAGTSIATPDGSAAVESLRAGDAVLTADGRTGLVRWVGHRAVDCSRHPKPWLVQPVRIRAGAFGPGLPSRDLLLSPDHAVFFDGVLIPVKHLLTGRLVASERVRTVIYHHVELDRHEIILAESLPVESYLDAGDRGSFANGGDVVDLHAAFGPASGRAALMWESCGAAPLVITGEPVLRAQQWLLEREAALRRKGGRTAGQRKR